MEFVIKSPEPIVVRVGEQSYNVRKPKLNEVEKLALLLKNKGDISDIQIMKDYLCALGLPEQVLGEMTIDVLNEFVDFISNPKKK